MMRAVLAFSLLTLTLVSAAMVDGQLHECEDECLQGCPTGGYCTADEYGCHICVGQELPPTPTRSYQERQDCLPVLCGMYCENGLAVDSNTGCEICSCA